MKKIEFVTHTGEIVSGERLQDAINNVANDWANLAYAIRKENAYAPHVTEKQKEDALNKMLTSAEEIRQGNINSFTIWQRVNNYLTGECVALLAK
jgi:hypothetical protein